MSPMASESKTTFYGKTLLYQLGSFLSALAALLCVFIATSFLLGWSKPANGIPGEVAAFRILLVVIVFGLFFILCWFHLLARRRPLLKICHEGLELNIIGQGSLDNVPGVPLSFKILWLVLSMQGFRKQIGWIPWELYRGVEVKGLRSMRTLTILGRVAYPRFHGDEISGTIRDHVVFRGSEFCDSLNEIADAIEKTCHDPSSWSDLPSFYDSAEEQYC